MLRALITATLVIGTSLAAVQAAAAQDLVPCAPENGYCRVPYPTRVVYGAGGRHATRHVGGDGVACSNGVFGDPAPGFPKRCAYTVRSGGDGWRDRDWGPPEFHRGSRQSARLHGEDGELDWQRCARENGFCSFRGVRRVKYGAGGRFVERVSRNGIACNNAVFGDPTPGVPKVCLVLD